VIGINTAWAHFKNTMDAMRVSSAREVLRTSIGTASVGGCGSAGEVCSADDEGTGGADISCRGVRLSGDYDPLSAEMDMSPRIFAPILLVYGVAARFHPGREPKGGSWRPAVPTRDLFSAN
jgi:hypothetical protein